MNMTMNTKHTKLTLIAVAVGLVLGVSASALAADNTTQTTTLAVDPINEIAVSGNPGAMTINAATAGSGPNAVTDATTTYDITTNGTNKKITAAIDAAMPTGTTLKVNLTAPAGATSAGITTLGTTAVDVVTAITEVAETGKSISYTFSATVAAGTLASFNKTVTFTILDGAYRLVN